MDQSSRARAARICAGVMGSVKKRSPEAELERLSLTDPLTALPNRRRFEQALDRAINDARGTGPNVSLLIVDVDHTKRFNDRYGHAVGDQVLKGIAHRLQASVRRPRDLVCRVGGEEFAILLPGADSAGAKLVAEAVHAEVSRVALTDAGIGAGAITVSVGAATSDDLGAAFEPADLLRLADEALYRAKAGGRNQTRWAEAAVTGSDRRVRLHVVGNDGTT